MPPRTQKVCRRCSKPTRNRPAVCDSCKPYVESRSKRYDSTRPGSRGYDRQWRKLRVHVLERDHYMCVQCRRAVGTKGHVDHILSKAKGGEDTMDNLQVLCDRCHGVKTRAGD